MSEGNIYLCYVEEKAGIFSLKLDSNESLVSRGTDFDDCVQDIYDQILVWCGDGEAVLEFFPSTGVKASKIKGGKSLYSSVSYNDTVNFKGKDNRFEKGNCPKCKHGLGRRNDNPVSVDVCPKAPVVGVWGVYPNLIIYSEAFLELFSPSELELFDVIPVLCDRSEINYFELNPLEVINAVGYRGAEYPTLFQQSWACSCCGRSSFTVSLNGLDAGATFISKNILPKTLSSVIFVKSGLTISVAFLNSRWAEILGGKKLKKLLSDPVVALDESYIEIPDIPETEKFDWI